MAKNEQIGKHGIEQSTLWDLTAYGEFRSQYRDGRKWDIMHGFALEFFLSPPDHTVTTIGYTVILSNMHFRHTYRKCTFSESNGKNFKSLSHSSKMLQAKAQLKIISTQLSMGIIRLFVHPSFVCV